MNPIDEFYRNVQSEVQSTLQDLALPFYDENTPVPFNPQVKIKRPPLQIRETAVNNFKSRNITKSSKKDYRKISKQFPHPTLNSDDDYPVTSSSNFEDNDFSRKQLCDITNKEIQDAKIKGLSLAKFATQIGVPYTPLRNYLNEHNLNPWKGKYSSLQKKINNITNKEIQDAKIKGLSLAKFATQRRVPYGPLRRYLNKKNYNLWKKKLNPKRKKPCDITNKEIQDAKMKGLSLAGFAKQIEVPYITLRRYLNKNDLNLWKKKLNPKRKKLCDITNEEINDAKKKGLSLVGFAKQIGVPSTTLCTHLNKNNYNLWKKKTGSKRKFTQDTYDDYSATSSSDSEDDYRPSQKKRKLY